VIRDCPTAGEILSLPYVELLALLGESNQPPGGFDTIRRLIVNCHLGPHTNVLHAGCNAGFLSRELARLSGCTITGIDISERMAEAANRRARAEGLEGRARYENRDMRDTRFGAATFDVTLSGGALAFVVDQPRAVREWLRVTKPFGLVADSELFYREDPPDSVRGRVSSIIGVEVPVYRESDWRGLFTHDLLAPYYSHVAGVQTRTADEVRAYCRKMIDFCASGWEAGAQEALFERLADVFLTFNENLKYMGYIVLVYRRLPDNSEPMLYN
jgi:SAM-dependent methyltransferase